MKKQRVAEIYQFLQTAFMARLTDEEKISLIRLLRVMKPVAREMQDAVEDAASKARENGVENARAFVQEAVADIASQEVRIGMSVLTADAFDRLALSNNWNFAQIDELSEILVKPE